MEQSFSEEKSNASLNGFSQALFHPIINPASPPSYSTSTVGVSTPLFSPEIPSLKSHSEYGASNIAIGNERNGEVQISPSTMWVQDLRAEDKEKTWNEHYPLYNSSATENCQAPNMTQACPDFEAANSVVASKSEEKLDRITEILRNMSPQCENGAKQQTGSSKNITNAFRCNICSQDVMNVRSHARTHLGLKIYQCPKCNYKAVWAYRVKQHGLGVHGTSAEPKLIMDCGEYAILQLEKIKECFDIDKATCSLCSKQFSLNTQMTCHAKTHLDIYPYQCPKCSFKSKHIRSCQAHQYSIHGSKAELLLRVNFVDYMDLVRGKAEECFGHTSSVSMNRDGAEFTLKRRIIKGRKSCKLCSKLVHGFKGSMQQHVPSHLSAKHKPYQCSQCCFKAFRKYGIVRHERSKHGNVTEPKVIGYEAYLKAAEGKMVECFGNPEEHWQLCSLKSDGKNAEEINKQNEALDSPVSMDLEQSPTIDKDTRPIHVKSWSENDFALQLQKWAENMKSELPPPNEEVVGAPLTPSMSNFSTTNVPMCYSNPPPGEANTTTKTQNIFEIMMRNIQETFKEESLDDHPVLSGPYESIKSEDGVGSELGSSSVFTPPSPLSSMIIPAEKSLNNQAVKKSGARASLHNDFKEQDSMDCLTPHINRGNAEERTRSGDSELLDIISVEVLGVEVNPTAITLQNVGEKTPIVSCKKSEKDERQHTADRYESYGKSARSSAVPTMKIRKRKFVGEQKLQVLLERLDIKQYMTRNLKI